ncbi:rubrerythrin-like domain-containing protein [Halorarius litoreus]|nr:rubrerythrin-like domain-containing protein [Halorarius litoreus]
MNPYDPTDALYECYDCGHRVQSESHQANCPECDGAVKNIAIARE